MNIITMDYDTGEVLRSADSDDIERSYVCEWQTGVFLDCDGNRVYLEGVPFDGAGYRLED